MINFALFTALTTFYFTMFFTPGPNNAMLTASGMKFGFVKTIPHLIGISLGHVFQIGLTCFGLANLFLFFFQVQFYIKVLCFLFVTITAAIINLPTCSLWALFGSGLRKFINNQKTKKIIEYLLAVLLVLTGLFILIK